MLNFYIRLRFKLASLLLQSAFKMHFKKKYIFEFLERIGIFEIKIITIDKIDLHIVLRINSSDNMVFQQVLIDKEYLPLIELNNIENPNILDCGANIGLTACFLNSYYKNSKIVCVEPDDFNLDVLKLNLALNNIRAEIVKGGIWMNSNTRLSIDKSFRDGKNWSYSVVESKNGCIQGYSLSYIAKKYFNNMINILKIDIEGAERYIFDGSPEIKSIVESTNLLVVEIHEEFDIEESMLYFLEKECNRSTKKIAQSFFVFD